MGRRPLPFPAAALVALAMSGPLGAAERTERFCGYAYGAADEKYRYTEVHEQVLDGDRWRRGTITYVAADGSTIGKKTLSFDSDPFIPAYRLELFGGRYVEGIERVAKERVEAFRKPMDDTRVERDRVRYRSPAAADSGFHALVQERFDSILSGKEQRFDFVVAGALDHFRFRVRKTGETMFEGRRAVKLVAEPDSLLSWVVDGLELTYDPVTRKLLDYRGPTNLLDPETGDGYDVRIVFPSTPPADAPAAATRACQL